MYIFMVARRGVVFSRWATAIAISVVLILAGAPSVAVAQRPPANVVVEKVRTTEVAQTFPIIGRFVARQHGVVAALTSGPLKETLVEVGERVTKGQVVARMVIDRIRANRNLLAAELREREAGLQTAEAQLKLTMGELKRLDGLRRSAAFSQARYSDKRNEVAKYRSEVTGAQGAVAKHMLICNLRGLTCTTPRCGRHSTRLSFANMPLRVLIWLSVIRWLPS